MVLKNCLKLSFIYVGTILGAGFASGKELVAFFARYKELGILGFLFSCFLLSISFISILGLIKNSTSKTYSDFLREIFGKNISIFIEFVNTIFLFTIFSTMLAGGGSALCEVLGVDFKICATIFAILIFFSLFFREKAIISINSILCPILIFLGAFIGIYIYFFIAKDVFSSSYKPFLSSIIYASYNIITTISVLFAVKKLILNKKVIFYGGILSGFLIFFIGIFLVLSLIENYNLISIKDLPILFILNEEKIIKLIYSILIFLAIYTTAISNGFALENILKSKLKNNIKNRFYIIFLGLVASFFGFSNMVENVYPIFGYLGLFQLIVIILKFYLRVV